MGQLPDEAAVRWGNCPMRQLSDGAVRLDEH
jgi:hypothetical protein